MPIEKDAGLKMATSFLADFAAGFTGNNQLETCGKYVADELSWDWSDGTKGTGKKEAVFEILKGGWGMMVSTFLPSENPIYIIDTDNNVIIISMPLCIHIDGGIPGAGGAVTNNCMFQLKVTDDLKITSWGGYWDNSSPTMVAAIADVMSKMEKK